MTIRAALPELAPSRVRACGLCLALFVFFFAAYVFTTSGDIFSTGDTTIRTAITDSFLKRHLDLPDWKLVYPHHLKMEFLDPRIAIGRNHKTYSTYLPGQPLAMIPLHLFGEAVAKHEGWPLGPTTAFTDRLVGPLFGALEVLVFFMFAVRLGYSRKLSFGLATVLGFATSVWPDEQSVLEHTEVAFFLLLGMYLMYRFADQRRNWAYPLLSGMAVGGAAITRYQDALIGVLAVAVYLAIPGSRSRPFLRRGVAFLLFLVGLAPFVVADLALNWYRFGSPLATGHHERVFGYPMALGAAGLVFSPGKGILWYCPVLFLSIFALLFFARRYPALACGITAVAAGFIALYANVTYWHGDPAWGPRYIFPIIPFLLLPVGRLFQLRFRLRPVLGAVSLCLIAASFLVQFAAVSVSEWRSWYRVISYEESQGHKWEWISARYRYFWDPRESPLNFQVHGLYQLAYDSLRHSRKYELVPPTEDPILDNLTSDYAINQWNFWWASNEFNWWMGQRKVEETLVVVVALFLASGVYLVGEMSGSFSTPAVLLQPPEPVSEAA